MPDESKTQQQLVDDWNAIYPVGTPVVRCTRINPLERPILTRTRSEAKLLEGHTAIVYLENHLGGVMLKTLFVPFTSWINEQIEKSGG